VRIAVGGIQHETSSFTPIATTLQAFEERFLLRGDAMLATFAGSNTPVGGFLEGVEAHPEIELVPTLHAEAHPSAPSTRATFETLCDELVERIAAAGRLDGVLLDLHGAMIAEGYEDCESTILERVRDAVGDELPIVVQLDIHANLSPRSAELADVLVGRRTYPEVDMAARGRDCAELVHRLVTGRGRGAAALQQLPFVWGVNQATEHPPMDAAIAQLDAVLRRPQVLAASISTGYPYGDVPCMGASVYVCSSEGADDAATTADELAAWIVERREQWMGELPTTAEALAEARAAGRYPVVLADRFDNTGAGTPGDSTGMLRTFLEADLEDACILYVVDPQSAIACIEAGVGARLALELGGKSADDQGPPVPLDVTVVAVSDGAFRYGGAMYAGLASSMGPSAHVVHRGVHVLIVSVREQPFDTAFAHSLALRPEAMRFVGVKSQAHFRAGFEAWAALVRVVREPSVHNPRAGALAYRRVRADVRAELGRA
jgi:microcystin degradation protein MlrC